MSNKHIVVLKNDAVGDLVHSIKAIENLISDEQIKKITIFLSYLNKDFSFLFNNKKIDIKILNNNLNIIDKIKLFIYLAKEKVNEVFILTPKSFYYFLPIFFFRIKFYAICINNINGYKRPIKFLRRFLYKFEINDRAATFKRDSTLKIQNNLTYKSNVKRIEKKIVLNVNMYLKQYIPSDYFYFHLNKKRLNSLKWGIDELKELFKEFLKYSNQVVITKDIEIDQNNKILKDNFNSIDLKNKKFIDRKSKIIFFDNVYGEDLYNLIRLSKKVIAFHGMMTNLASIEKKSVLDLFYCKIENWNDYRNYRNSFYEFKPSYNGYDFIIPKKDIKQTIKKINFSITK